MIKKLGVKMYCADYILKKGEAWLKYAYRINVLNEDKNSLKELRDEVLSDPRIKAFLTDIGNFHDYLVSNHKNPDLSIHKLIFLLEMGLDTDVEEINIAINEILPHKDEKGMYQSKTNIPKHFGGSGEDTFGWCLCDAPLMLYALYKAGVDYEEYIKQGVEFIAGLIQNKGFPCVVSKEHGKFRGPGKKDDCCPYATLIILKLLSNIPEYRQNKICIELAETILSLWENSLEKHPYLFYMGKDFRKLKAPLIWYDIVSVTDVLSRFEFVKNDVRYKEMIQIIKEKQDENGLYTPESVYLKLKDWDFGQKKIPSPYLTYICSQIILRTGIV